MKRITVLTIQECDDGVYERSIGNVLAECPLNISGDVRQRVEEGEEVTIGEDRRMGIFTKTTLRVDTLEGPSKDWH